MYTEKEKVLKEAESVLNKEDQPWNATVEGDCIIARWKWMDATFFSINDISDVERNYKFTVKLKDNGKWKEIDETNDKKVSVGLGGLSFERSAFIGNTSQKYTSYKVGIDNQKGEKGVLKFKFDTAIIKKPIREYLTSCGWKKAGLFG